MKPEGVAQRIDGGRLGEDGSAAVLEAPTGIAGLYNVAVVGESVEHSGGHVGVAEDLGPVGECQVGGDQQRGVLIELADQIEQQLAASLAVALATLAGWSVSHILELPNLSMIFLAAVLYCAVSCGTWSAVTASVLSFLCYNFFFIEPRYTLTIARPHELLALIIFLLVAVFTGSLAGRVGELLARIRAALRNRPQGEPAQTVFEVGALTIDVERHWAKRDGVQLKLTRKEFDLLLVLVRHAGRVLTRRYILNAVWGPAHTEDLQYLRVLIGQLRLKIEVKPDEPEVIITEPGIGYRLNGPG